MGLFSIFRRSKKQVVEEVTLDPRLQETPHYEIVATLLTDVGCHREANEDSSRYLKPSDPGLYLRKGALAVVADGMGGHSAGEVASKIAVETILRVYFEEKGDTRSSLQKAVKQANREIYEASTGDDNLRGMGTTCTALVLKNGSAVTAHVGDSRLYLIRNGQIYLMTEDHSAVMEMVKRGLLTLEEARHHPDKNVILRALGSHPDVEVGLWDEPFPVKEGDSFLLCSDGLYDLVEDEDIRQTVVSSSSIEACEKLIDLAKRNGGYDNITVGIFSIKAEDAPVEVQVRETRELEAIKK